jgi:hypothetical protein
VYDGELPPKYPVKLDAYWTLYTDLLTKHKVTGLPASVGKCPKKDTKGNVRYVENNMYSPSNTNWIWHAPPYKELKGDDGWVEVFHLADPFGDEHHGLWFLYAKGSGVWYKLGKSISFKDHKDAYKHFKVPSNVDQNEAMSVAAAKAGFDTIQFIAHKDHTNYPCTKSSKESPADYMNIEIVAVKLVGTYACGSQSGGKEDYFRAGWHSKSCTCDNKLKISNCGKLLRSIGGPELRAEFANLHPAEAAREAHERKQRQRHAQKEQGQGPPPAPIPTGAVVLSCSLLALAAAGVGVAARRRGASRRSKGEGAPPNCSSSLEESLLPAASASAAGASGPASRCGGGGSSVASSQQQEGLQGKRAGAGAAAEARGGSGSQGGRESSRGGCGRAAAGAPSGPK